MVACDKMLLVNVVCAGSVQGLTYSKHTWMVCTGAQGLTRS